MSATNEKELRQAIREFIVENFLVGDEKDELDDTDSFMANGYIDSTGILELTEYLEKSYQVKVEDEDMVPDNLDSINNLVRYISLKIAV